MRILIAEDDPFSLKILRLMLATEDRYEVVGVSDGLAAWRELDEGLGFNLCIFDLMMPGLDGLELTRRMRQDPRFSEQRVIFCTALNDRETIDRAVGLGVSHYIVKPYTKEFVLRQVRRACEETTIAEYFETLSDVSVRLGVSASMARQLLSELHFDLLTVEEAILAKKTPDHIRVNALKSAAVNLGARALAVRLAQLESVLLTTADLSRIAPGLAAENERLRLHLGLERPPAPIAASPEAAAPAPAAAQAPGAPSAVAVEAPLSPAAGDRVNA